LVRQLFTNILETAENPETLEVILYVDDDDAESARLACASLRVVKLIGPRVSMGAMTRACHEASRGRYIALINDDMIFRTQAWDSAVADAFARHGDDIALVYANDLYYGDKVATFPILSRKACEVMGGIVPQEYQSHSIDSHLFDVFERLGKLGFDRLTYLPEVVFEHLQHGAGHSAARPTPGAEAQRDDRRRYLALSEEREKIARKLAEHIRSRQAARRPDDIPSVSIIVDAFRGIPPTEGLRRLESLARRPCGREVLWAHDMAALNRAARSAEGEFLVFLDGRARPWSGWLEALLGCAADTSAGIVGSKGLNPRSGRIEHAGIGFYRDNGILKATRIYEGFPANSAEVDKRRPFQAVARVGMLVKKSLFLDAGGFALDLPGVEHIGLCLKARRLGASVIFEPEAVLYCVPPDEGPGEEGLGALSAATGMEPKPDLDDLLAEDGFRLDPVAQGRALVPAAFCKITDCA